jgi:hypothetical protein
MICWTTWFCQTLGDGCPSSESSSVARGGDRSDWVSTAVVNETEGRATSELLSQRLADSESLDAAFLAALEAGANLGVWKRNVGSKSGGVTDGSFLICRGEAGLATGRCLVSRRP